MNDPIDRLLAEHRVIMERVADLRRAVSALERRGAAAVPDVLPALEAVGALMGRELLAHARREDEALFPALEEAFGAADTPTSVMREEHRAIHARADLFRRTLQQLNEVEHPAIVAGGARLRALTAAVGQVEDLHAVAREILLLLDAHFAKEEEILFPMARQILSPQTLEQVAAAMERIDDVP